MNATEQRKFEQARYKVVHLLKDFPNQFHGGSAGILDFRSDDATGYEEVGFPCPGWLLDRDNRRGQAHSKLSKALKLLEYHKPAAYGVIASIYLRVDAGDSDANWLLAGHPSWVPLHEAALTFLATVLIDQDLYFPGTPEEEPIRPKVRLTGMYEDIAQYCQMLIDQDLKKTVAVKRTAQKFTVSERSVYRAFRWANP